MYLSVLAYQGKSVYCWGTEQLSTVTVTVVMSWQNLSGDLSAQALHRNLCQVSASVKLLPMTLWLLHQHKQKAIGVTVDQ